MKFHDKTLADWQRCDKLMALDQAFLDRLADTDKNLHLDLLQYRKARNSLSAVQISELIISAGKVLDDFLIGFFEIEDEAETLEKAITAFSPIFGFKKWFVLRRAKRRLLRDEALPEFGELDAWLKTKIDDTLDREYAIAQFGLGLLDDKDLHDADIETLTQWCIQALKTPEGQKVVAGWGSFILPNRTDYKRLIPIVPIGNADTICKSLPDKTLRKRDGFDLTDPRMSQAAVMSEIDYCVYCHDHDGDLCSKGFPEKKSDPDAGFKTNPLGNTLTGCPLDEKISEMISLKKSGFSLAALATVMIDNPMCPATGHRICNDCMKSCIYQKQDPVDVPEIETRVLTDVLDLPWGVEIYDLLTRWNPLRSTQYLPKPYQGKHIYIAGMGPAGFTLSHHLLMAGFGVVGTDGLKIEPLSGELIDKPIKHFSDILEPLSDRVMAGFGGVAEYGITVRWDKNFLKLIYISLSRRSHMQIMGGVRFGGTVEVDDLWDLGFHHGVIAVGAGLPRALPIKNSLAKGMRQANDFLMALQLTGAAKDKSLANLQLRLPCVVIGGGLTGVDAATEAQAYYVLQTEKTLDRYQALCDASNETDVRAEFDKESLIIIDEFITHAKAFKAERTRAKAKNETPNFTPLIREFGGVTIAYRKAIADSPAYRGNHHELYKALEEGLLYAEGLQPVEAVLDDFNAVSQIVFNQLQQNEEGVWLETENQITLPAKSVLVATGAQPNISYTFEHPKIFKRNGLEYQPYEMTGDGLAVAHRAEHTKTPDFGPFTSYEHEDKHMTFIGDTHPTFHGNVVGAVASAYRTYPKIVTLFEADSNADIKQYETFAKRIQHAFTTSVTNVTPCTDNITEITIHAPKAAAQHAPGQFYRLQNDETHAKCHHNTRMQSEPLAMTAFDVDREKGTLRFMIMNVGTSSNILSNLNTGDPIALMGPTGVRSKIPEDQQTILIAGHALSLSYLRAVAPALKAAGNRVIYIAEFETASQCYCLDDIIACTDLCIFTTNDNTTIPLKRKQDQCMPGNVIDAILSLSNDPDQSLADLDRITLIGNPALLKSFQKARAEHFGPSLKPSIKVFASAYANMQCMLKGVCAQCLQWQIDPETGERKKAVFTCSWQDQPIELIDIDNLKDRQAQNKATETLSRLYLSGLDAIK
jgi:NADPH-dependent glutamate synthase beta subunit-like oxidoreductase/NAD(P)H-flavin reductase